MIELPEAISDYKVLLALEPEELAAKMLFLLRQRGGSMLHPGNMENELWGNISTGKLGYPVERQAEISAALIEAWAWLEAQGLVVPQDNSMNGQNGWRRLSRRAQRMESAADFANFRTARLLPREVLHPKIADPVWLAFMRGGFDVAVFEAMKAVEIAVREASRIPELGIKLMRKAFDPESGALTDMEAEKGEREARSALFAGAIGSFKNPHSHRNVGLTDAGEAVEIIMLANHLLRIVDEREAAGP